MKDPFFPDPTIQHNYRSYYFPDFRTKGAEPVEAPLSPSIMLPVAEPVEANVVSQAS